MLNKDSSIILDTNIILYLENNLDLLCKYFNKIFIHKFVISEILTNTLKWKLEQIKNQNPQKLIYVDNSYTSNLNSPYIYNASEDELQSGLNTNENKDLGEYYTLLYAKFNDIKFIISSDMKVSSIIKHGINFKNLACYTLEDLLFYIHNAAISSSDDKRTIRNIYNKHQLKHNDYNEFKAYLDEENCRLPKYYDFQKYRQKNYYNLVSGYVNWNRGSFISENRTEDIIVEVAKTYPQNCKACVLSSIDPSKVSLGFLRSRDRSDNIVYSSRICTNKGRTCNNCNIKSGFFSFKIHINKDRLEEVAWSEE